MRSIMTGVRSAAMIVAGISTLVWAVPQAGAQDDPEDIHEHHHDHIGYRGIGPRIGLSVDPDQFVVGGHIDFGNFARHVRFQPNVELGFGENITLISINGDVVYRFAENWDSWSPYLGGGIGLNIYSFDDEFPGEDDTHSDLGVNLVGGIERGLASGSRFFIEAKLGLADAPDAKFLVGWTFF